MSTSPYSVSSAAGIRKGLLATSCQLHAYVLMSSHVHLLATPLERGAIAFMMQKLGRQYVGQFSARHRRTGTLWEGRYKVCLVDADGYLLRCVRYIDLNPVRARMIDDRPDFPGQAVPRYAGNATTPC